MTGTCDSDATPKDREFSDASELCPILDGVVSIRIYGYMASETGSASVSWGSSRDIPPPVAAGIAHLSHIRDALEFRLRVRCDTVSCDIRCPDHGITGVNNNLVDGDMALIIDGTGEVYNYRADLEDAETRLKDTGGSSL